MTAPQRPAFQWTISLGTVITIALLLVSVTGAYYTATQRIALAEDRLEKLEAASDERQRGLRVELAAVETRTRLLETGSARSDEKMSNVLLLLNRIDSRLERLEQRMNGGEIK